MNLLVLVTLAVSGLADPEWYHRHDCSCAYTAGLFSMLI